MNTSVGIISLLLVEDDPVDTLLVHESLQEMGLGRFQTIDACNVSEAVQCLAQNSIDVILLDLNLPDSQGLATLRTLQSFSADKPILIFSGLKDEELAMEALKEGAQDFMVKGETSSRILEHGLRKAIERQRLIQTIIRKEAHIHEIIEQNSDGIIVVDGEGIIRFANPAAVKLFGRRSGELVGEIFGFPITGTDRTEVTVINSQGNTTDVELYVTHFYWEEEPALLVSLRDITQRKRAEQALAESEKRYRALFEDSPVAVWAEDFSALKGFVDDLKKQGVTDFRGYLTSHPGVVLDCTKMIKMVDANRAALQMYRAGNKEDLFRYTARVLMRGKRAHVFEDVIAIAAGETSHGWEGTDETVQGEAIDIVLSWSVAPGYEDDFARVIVTTMDITERRNAERNIKLQIQRLRALRAIDIAIASSFNLKITLDLFLREVVTQLDVDAASVFLFDKGLSRLNYIAGKGFRSLEFPKNYASDMAEYAGKVVREREIVRRSFQARGAGDARPSSFSEEGFVEYFGAPLIVKGLVNGILEVYHRQPLRPDAEWLEFLEVLAGQAAIAIDDAQLFDNLQKSNAELSQAYDKTIEGWSHAMDLRDKETEGHTQRVTELTLKLAHSMGFPEEELVQIRRGALLHDIGKLGIRDNILLKPGKLTTEEREIMNQHPQFAYEMLMSIEYLKPALDIPYCHHEKWDGSGYPRGLRGEDIPLSARIFAVIDVWDALTSDRPYRAAWTKEEAANYIQEQSGEHFDPQIVDLFMREINRA